MPSFADHYRNLHTEDLLDTAGKDLLPEARAALQQELESRGVKASQVEAVRAEAARVEALRTEVDSRLASRFKRLVAFLVDVWGVGLLLYIALMPLKVVSTDFYAFVCAALWLAYFLLRDSIPGQSLGKRLLGLRAVQEGTNLSCTWATSLARNITHFFFYIDALFALGERRRRLGDIMAKTQVVRAQPAREA